MLSHRGARASRRVYLCLGLIVCCPAFTMAVAAGPANTPEAVISAYLAIPTARWQERLPYVAAPEKVSTKFFARKDTWADTLLELDRGQVINIIGVVTPLEGTSGHGVVVRDIEVLD